MLRELKCLDRSDRGRPNRGRHGETACRLAVGITLAAIVLAGATQAVAQDYFKWDQPPEPGQPNNDVYYGWNEVSIYGGYQIAADDWVCDSNQPVSDIHWWGSFVGWNQPEPPPESPIAFRFAIWTDEPGGAMGFSHPDIVLWEHECADFTWEFVGWDFDPQTEQFESCFLFHCDLPQPAWFHQDPYENNVYWVSIAAVYCNCNGDVNGDGTVDSDDVDIVQNCDGIDPNDPTHPECADADVDCNGQIDFDDLMVVLCQTGTWPPDPTCCVYDPNHPFGVKTRPRNPDSPAPDDAVRIFYPTAPQPPPHVYSQWGDGEPLRWPDPNNPEDSWDLAFYLTSKHTGPGIDYKWQQPPVFDPNSPEPDCFWGWDERSDWQWGPIIADDWVCLDDRPVTDVHWWGSYQGWDPNFPPLERPAAFHIGVWTDVPADPNDPNPFSHPGEMIWEWWVDPNQITETYAGCDFHPDWTPFPEACFYYSYDIPSAEWFYQNPDDHIYWISISATYEGPDPLYPWGWKTRPRSPESLAPDDAVRIWVPSMPEIGTFYEDGEPIEWPDPDSSWDMAFELTTRAMGYKWQQPPVFDPNSPYPECFWGWDDVSDYDMMTGPIVADDWVCADDRPITDIHWWGSYLGWDPNYPPPETPSSFHIGIWTDLPVDPNDPNSFSHPDLMIWEWWADPGTLSETYVGCDFHPDWMPGPESCFYYTFNIPQEEWFYQDPNQHIYWVSISARYPTAPPNPWGWKTRPRDPDSPAPDDAVRIFDVFPSPPTPGSFYLAGEPIWWPDPDSSWDMAFELTTLPYEETIKWNQPPEPHTPADVYTGWNEKSVHSSRQIAADDWVCENDDPITNLHWWGSFLGWGEQTLPPETPDWFHVVIWTDVPVGDPNNSDPFSHPGEMIWDHFCVAPDVTSSFVGWDFDPRDPNAPPEACFYFEYDLPEADWFYQEPNDNIYWVSIAAGYDGYCECNGDFDGDGLVDINDLQKLLQCSGGPGTGCCRPCDLDCDGDVDEDDQGIFMCQYGGGPPDPNCCPNYSVPQYPFGMKTRPRLPDSLAPDDGVRVLCETAPADPNNNAYIEGEALYWPDPSSSWDLAFQLTATHQPEPWLEPKWTQPPYPPEAGFDAISNLWWDDPNVVNAVVADDFYSDGRDVLDVRWWGSCYDPRYETRYPPIEPYVLDGWLIAFHWADANTHPTCPPALLYDPPPTVLAVYFAPPEAVYVMDTGGVDCLGHRVYAYEVDLDDCCLICTHPDPRNDYPTPGLPGVFQEVEEYRYWISVQAVTGAEWLPPDCVLTLTGHLPPLDVSATGEFWGWHNGYQPADPPAPLDTACVGKIFDFDPYPPGCWDYGDWLAQDWLCPSQPEPVNLAFDLLAYDCPENVWQDGSRVINVQDLAELLSRYNKCVGDPTYVPAYDFNNDGCINLSDLAQLLSVYNDPCPTY